jgi:hypothetical protein
VAGTTVVIPLVTLPVGSQDFGPAAISDADSLIAITINRNVVGGLNSLTSATQIVMTSFVSFDGGVTWNEMASATTTGGILPKGGGTSAIQVNLWPGTGRQVKANVTVSGSPAAVSGSVATS